MDAKGIVDLYYETENPLNEIAQRILGKSWWEMKLMVAICLGVKLVASLFCAMVGMADSQMGYQFYSPANLLWFTM